MEKGLIVVGLILLVIVLLLLGPTIYGIVNLEPDALRVWAIVATLALPGAFILGLVAGATRAKTTIEGLDRGIEAVIAAASEVADIKDRSFRKTVQHAKPQFNIAMLSKELPQVQHEMIEGEVERIDL
jgi:H+/Cl- antiporter ClcA